MIWMHRIMAGHILPLESDHKVFGSDKGGYFIIAAHSNGSRWMMPVVHASALIRSELESILSMDAEKLYRDTSKWGHARDIWPDQYVQVEMLSPCCSAKIDGSRGDGVMVGSCSTCGTDIVRQNPKTGVEEWLDGKSPWTDEELRPVDVAA